MTRDDIEVYVDFVHGLKRVGLIRRAPKRDGESIHFEYDRSWLADPHRFSLEPALNIQQAHSFSPDPKLRIFGSLGDSAPDTWGRRLMRNAERRAAKLEGRAPRTLLESDFVLGVADVSRLGALRFKLPGDNAFQSPRGEGVPSMVKLGDLLRITERVLRNEETDVDMRMIFAPGSSLGGARPKASVLDQHGRLAIAKFPKEDDEYSKERWEHIALKLASNAGISVAHHELLIVASRPVLLSRRFDRDGQHRVPFLSAMAMMGMPDGEPGSYPEIMDMLNKHGADPARDGPELFRRLVFNVLISNVDDHLRNHGFLWKGSTGWSLSPAYDLNPVPIDISARELSTQISLDSGICDIQTVRSVAPYFDLRLEAADAIIHAVAQATQHWRMVAKAEGASPGEIDRMSSAFEHSDLTSALAAPTAVPLAAKPPPSRRRRSPS